MLVIFQKKRVFSKKIEKDLSKLRDASRLGFFLRLIFEYLRKREAHQLSLLQMGVQDEEMFQFQQLSASELGQKDLNEKIFKMAKRRREMDGVATGDGSIVFFLVSHIRRVLKILSQTTKYGNRRRFIFCFICSIKQYLKLEQKTGKLISFFNKKKQQFFENDLSADLAIEFATANIVESTQNEVSEKYSCLSFTKCL